MMQYFVGKGWKCNNNTSIHNGVDQQVFVPGNRQKGRLNAGNVIFVKHKKDEIKKAIIKSIFNKKYKQKIKNIKNPYGNGTSSKKIVKILDKLTINDTLLIKDITY